MSSIRHWAGPLLIAATGATMAVLTWNTWPDPIVDFGKEAYIGWQLSQGSRLYIDVAYHLGPLSPLIIAGNFQIFGTSLLALEVQNLIFLAGMLALTYILIFRFAGSVAATVCCIVFILLFAFTHFTPVADYNFIAPYDHAHTHGILFGLVALSTAEMSGRLRARWRAIAAGVAVGLVFLTRAELFVAAFGGALTILALSPRRRFGLFFAGFFAMLIVFFVALCHHLPAAVAFHAILGSWPIVFDTSIAAGNFYRDSMGTLNTSASILRLLSWSAIWLLIFLPPFALSKIKAQGASSLGFRRTLIAASFIWGILASLTAGHFLDPADAFTPLPLAVLACLIVIWKRKAPPVAWGFAIWSLLLLGKIALNARIYHYGFALAMPATLLVIAVGLSWTPAPLKAAIVGSLIVVTIAYLSLAYRLTQNQTVLVGSRPNQFWSNPTDGQLLNDATAYLHDHATPGDTLAVMPEGAMLNFLTRMNSSVPYWFYNPPYSFFFLRRGEAYAEQQFLEALKSHPPDWIVLSDPSDPRSPILGRDFGLSLYNFVRQNYSPVSSLHFGIILQHRGYNEHGDTNASSPR